MANLYRDAYWSQKDLDSHIGEAQKQATKCKMGCFSMDRMKYYNKQLCHRQEEGYRTSFIDLWGLMIEYLLNDGVWYIQFVRQPCIFLLVNREKTTPSFQRMYFKAEWSSPCQKFSVFLIYSDSLPREKCILYVNILGCRCSHLKSSWYLTEVEVVSGSLPKMQFMHAKRVQDANQSDLTSIKTIQSMCETAKMLAGLYPLTGNLICRYTGGKCIFYFCWEGLLRQQLV